MARAIEQRGCMSGNKVAWMILGFGFGKYMRSWYENWACLLKTLLTT